MKAIISNQEFHDSYHNTRQLNIHVVALAAAAGCEVSVGSFKDMDEHYNTRLNLAVVVARQQKSKGLVAGWCSEKPNEDWVVLWAEAKRWDGSSTWMRYHYLRNDMQRLLPELEEQEFVVWNGVDETLASLEAMAGENT